MERFEIKSKQEWKKLEVDTTLIDKEILDGFCGIEELTDYEIIKKPREIFKAPKPEKPQSKKRKLEGLEIPDVVSSKKQATGKKEPKPAKVKTINSEKIVPAKTGKSKLKKSQLTANVKSKVKKSYDKCEILAPRDEENAASDETALQAVTDGWKDLYVPEPVLRALAEMGFSTPTSIQVLTLPSAIRDRKDIVGAAETGSGKTLAFGIPIIHHILQDKEKEALDDDEDSIPHKRLILPLDDEEEPETDSEEPLVTIEHEKTDVTDKIKGRNSKLRCLIMTPTRELAVQIKDHLVAVTRYTDIKIAVIVGGLASQKQYRILKKQPDIVIGTPGRLWELIQEGEPHLAKVTSVKYLVIDEADRLLEKGHFEELSQIMDRIKSDEEAKAARQTFVFSATLTLVHALPQRILAKQKKKFRSNQKTKLENLLLAIGVKEKPKIVDITRPIGTSETLLEARINCGLNEKDNYLYYFLTQYPGRTLVFCNSIDCVRRLNNIFGLLQRKPWPLHAQMIQRQRLKNLERFTASGTGLLLATDVAARGLDIPNVEHVIHYQVPRTTEAYIHRSGRTARATKEGISVTLIEPNEMQLYRKICKTLKRDKELPVFPVDLPTLRQAKLRVDLAKKLDLQEHRARKKRSQNNWFEKAAEEMDIELDREDLLNDMGEEYDQATDKREMKSLQLQLNQLLRTPIMPKTLTTRYPAYGNNLNAMLAQVPVPEKAIAVMKEKRIQDKIMPVVHGRLKNKAKKSKNKKNKRKKH